MRTGAVAPAQQRASVNREQRGNISCHDLSDPGNRRLTFHEAAHGFVAYLIGDDTAWRLGRVYPFGTILLPGDLLDTLPSFCALRRSRHF
jgi:hypothetical protein